LIASNKPIGSVRNPIMVTPSTREKEGDGFCVDCLKLTNHITFQRSASICRSIFHRNSQGSSATRQNLRRAPGFATPWTVATDPVAVIVEPATGCQSPAWSEVLVSS
jgi:hypothetical protein